MRVRESLSWVRRMRYLDEDQQFPQFPWMNLALIGINLGCFAYELSLGPALPSFLITYGWIPEQFSLALTHGHIPVLSPLLVSTFLHGGWLHLLGNLVCLLILGGDVEQRLGAVRYLGLYMCGSLVALLSQTAVAPFSPMPMIGSSGAIAAVAGTYCIFFFTLQDFRVTPQLLSGRIERIPAMLFLVAWFLFHLVVGIYAHAVDMAPSSFFARIAWGAHVGGFLGGILLGPMLLAHQASRRRVPVFGDSQLVFGRPKSLLR